MNNDATPAPIGAARPRLDRAEAHLDAMRKIAYILIEEADPTEAASCIELLLPDAPIHTARDLGKLLDEVQHGDPGVAGDRARQLVAELKSATMPRTEQTDTPAPHWGGCPARHV